MGQPDANDALKVAMEIAADPQAQASFAGNAPAQSRSLWSKMNLKVKILSLAIPIGFAYLALPHSALPGGDQQASANPTFQSAAAKAAPPLTATALPSLAQKTASVETYTEKLAKALESDTTLTSNQISQRLVNLDPFASLATAVEAFKSKPYFDPGGLNVGMGYCITKRVSEYGSNRVKDDMLSAGFTEPQADALLHGKKTEISKIEVTPLMAAKLMDITKPDYQNIARDGIGADVFDKMPIHRQAAMSYMAYNTGDVGKFKQLVAGIRSGSDSKAMLNMTVNWRDRDGEMHANHRLRSYVQAMFLGADHFKRAIENPSLFESNMSSANAEGAMAEIAAASQKPNGLQSKILERRLKANPWAFKAFSEEKKKLPSATGS